MISQRASSNLEIYELRNVAAHYAALDYLTPCERLLFAAYVAPGSAILDLGVGGGRTTPYLSNRASHYVGVDYAAAMVRVCQDKFPNLEFVVADGSDLARFRDASFDVVVFAFNGIDSLSDEGRKKCLAHIQRVLKPGGLLIFSSHNPRAIIIRRGWNRERLRKIASSCSAGSRLLYFWTWPVLASVRAAVAFAQTLGATMRRAGKRLPSRMFWRGEGNLMDSEHGGIFTHYWTPQHVVRELASFHFAPQRILGDDYPLRSYRYTTDWYYYVFRKPSVGPCDSS